MAKYLFLFLACLCNSLMAGLEHRDAVVQIQGDKGMTQGSAVCVSEDGMFVSIGHIKFTIGKTYYANWDDTRPAIRLKCLSVRELKDDPRDSVVVLKAEDSSIKYEHVEFGNNPTLGDKVYIMGYAAGNFTYIEGFVINQELTRRTFWADFRVLEGCSGGGIFNQRGELIGITQERSYFPFEDNPNNEYRPDYSVFVKASVFEPCVEYARNIDESDKAPAPDPVQPMPAPPIVSR